MTFAHWLALNGMDDAAAGEKFGRDRGHISKLRRGKTQPSFELACIIRDKTDGAVTLDSWMKAKRKKAA